MKTYFAPFTVYVNTPFQYDVRPRSSNRYVRSRSFSRLSDALEFAAAHDVNAIYDYSGSKMPLNVNAEDIPHVDRDITCRG